MRTPRASATALAVGLSLALAPGEAMAGVDAGTLARPSSGHRPRP